MSQKIIYKNQKKLSTKNVRKRFPCCTKTRYLLPTPDFTRKNDIDTIPTTEQLYV